jgi:hypothetical protein
MRGTGACERMEVMELSGLSTNSQRSSQQQALWLSKNLKLPLVVVVSLGVGEFHIDLKGLKVRFPLISTIDSR